MDFKEESSNNKMKNSNKPLFSIVISSYNRALLLPRALDSLIAQTETEWEAIVVDDGSTDQTESVVGTYSKHDSRIKYHKKVHSGESDTKNAGITISTGRYITFLDSDDEYDSDHLRSRKTLIDENAGVTMIHGGVMIIGDKFVPDRFDISKKISLTDCVIGGTFFIERKVLKKLGGFHDIAIGTDADLFDRIRDANYSILETKIPTYIYHHENVDSITNKFLRDKRID